MLNLNDENNYDSEFYQRYRVWSRQSLERARRQFPGLDEDELVEAVLGEQLSKNQQTSGFLYKLGLSDCAPLSPECEAEIAEILNAPETDQTAEHKDPGLYFILCKEISRQAKLFLIGKGQHYRQVGEQMYAICLNYNPSYYGDLQINEDSHLRVRSTGVLLRIRAGRVSLIDE